MKDKMQNKYKNEVNSINASSSFKEDTIKMLNQQLDNNTAVKKNKAVRFIKPRYITLAAGFILVVFIGVLYTGSLKTDSNSSGGMQSSTANDNAYGGWETAEQAPEEADVLEDGARESIVVKPPLSADSNYPDLPDLGGSVELGIDNVLLVRDFKQFPIDTKLYNKMKSLDELPVYMAPAAYEINEAEQKKLADELEQKLLEAAGILDVNINEKKSSDSDYYSVAGSFDNGYIISATDKLEIAYDTLTPYDIPAPPPLDAPLKEHEEFIKELAAYYKPLLSGIGKQAYYPKPVYHNELIGYEYIICEGSNDAPISCASKNIPANAAVFSFDENSLKIEITYGAVLSEYKYYPKISENDAIAKINAANDEFSKKDIEATEFIYIRRGDYSLPYYRFYIRSPEKDANNLSAYIFYDVPAVDIE